MRIKILVATHKRYNMPKDNVYLPIHVGKLNKMELGYIGDDTGENISKKNPYYCELTGIYWGVKNLTCDYIGLVHYRRHFSNLSLTNRLFINDKFECILKEGDIKELCYNYDIILPKKRKYYIESIYNHYGHTHYIEHLDETRKIIYNKHIDYIESFDKVMKRKSAHMFNMFIMKKELAEEYCEWLFSILFELEKKIDISNYDFFQARLYGRVSELLLDVWIEKNKFKYKEVPYIYMEKVNWFKKGSNFLYSKILNKKLKNSF